MLLKDKYKKIGVSLFGILSIFLVVIAMLISITTPISAITTVDQSTLNTYKDSFHLEGNTLSTRYSGRVWTDKSVTDNDITLTGSVGEETIEKGQSDFLITYSALATSHQIIGKSQVPVDVVFVIDHSNSMDSAIGNGWNSPKRLEATVDAVNSSIQKIMESHTDSRIAVVTYGNDSQILLPLDHYTSTSAQYIEIGSNRLGQNTNVLQSVEGLKNSQGKSVSEKNERDSYARGTNIHNGVDMGMDILAEVQNIGDDANKHVPSLILLSDGAATYSSGGSSWWNPTDSTSGNGSSPSTAHDLKVIMNAQYMKQKVNQNYGVGDNSDYACRIYTIGMGIEELNTTQKRHAQITLDPASYINSNNNVAKEIKNAWDSYSKGENPRLDSFRFTHPDDNDIDTIHYNDGYYEAENAEDVNNVFDDITSSIIMSRPQVPTQVDSSDVTRDGYITYTDPLGQYMKVDSIKSMIYADKRFDQVEKEIDGETTTYRFQGEVESPVYGKQDVSDILITVTKESNHQETLTVKIPASVIPIYVTTVDTDKDGQPIQITSNNAYPLRIIYGVSRDFENISEVDDQYINTHLSDDGEYVQFYSNLYNGNKQGDVTVGDTMVEFTPTQSNPFYYFQEDVTLYSDKDCQNQATFVDEDSTYYFKISYYEDLNLKEAIISRKGELLADYIKKQGQGLYIQKGSPRLGNLQDFAQQDKNNNHNQSGTAQSYYYPTLAEDGKSFKIFLGNNGKLQIEAPSSLVIKKEVTASSGLTAPDREFQFELTIESKKGQTVTAMMGDQSQSLTFDENGKTTVTLKKDQSIEILNLGEGIQYSLREINIPDGFEAMNREPVNGTISQNDAENIVTFTNHYNVSPTTSSELKLPLSGQKQLTGTGREFQQGDQFTFTIRAAQTTPNAPLPKNQAGQDMTSVTVYPTNGTETQFQFDGTITFTQPGEYRYIIQEQKGDLAGIDYDSTIYRISVVIVDDGQGHLVLADVDDIDATIEYKNNPYVQKYANNEFTDETNIVFKNHYSAQDATISIQGKKVLDVINSDYQLKDGDFAFNITPLGFNTDDGNSFNGETSSQPMPENSKVQNISNGNIIFNGLTFTQDMVGKTYGYKITEVLPSGVSDAQPTIHGITYDTSEKIVKVKVTTQDGYVQATVSPSDDSQNFTFTNVYQPDSVTIGEKTNNGLQVQKTFIGRNWIDDKDSFTFVLSSKNNAPMPENNEITMNTSSETTLSFGDIEYEEKGVYKYEIKEKNTGMGGIKYDSHTAFVTVTVSEDKSTGKLFAKVEYDNSQALTQTDRQVTDKAAFTNQYEAIFDAETAISLNAEKQLTGPLALENGMFEFIITYPDQTQKTVLNTGHNVSLLNNVQYDKAGTYVYTIKENQGTRDGVTYDATIYRVTVTVTDDQVGHLTAQISKVESSQNNGQSFVEVADKKIIFTNQYQPLSSTYTPVSLTKKLIGDRKDSLKENEFQFEMSVVSADPKDGIQLPSEKVVGNTQDGKVQFGDITFTKAGTYIVQVKEVIPDEGQKVDGVQYDTHVIQSTFKVIDQDGQLKVSRTNVTGSHEFTNEYRTSGQLIGQDSLTVKKILVGRPNDKWLTTDQFLFTLEGYDEATKKAIDEGKIELPQNAENLTISASTVNQEASFGDITFHTVGEYQFVIKEDDSNKIDGISYDTTPRIIYVKTADQGDGTLQVIVDNSSLKNEFKNTYEATGTAQYTIEGQKTLKNRDWNDTDEFTFVLEAENDQTKEAIDKGVVKVNPTGNQAIVNKEHQNYQFDLTFSQIGDYQFIVKEEKGTIPGITYDSHEVHIDVSVVDDNQGGIEAVTAVGSSGSLDFENTYAPLPTIVPDEKVIEIYKTLNGRDMKSGEFQFTITPDEGQAITIDGQAGKDGVQVLVDKYATTFTQAGTKTFTVKEVKDQDALIPGITYDQSEYVVTYTAVDNQKGSFDIERTITKNGKDVSKIEFVNSYKASSTSLAEGQISGQKIVENSDSNAQFDLKANDFEFVIKALNNGPLPSQTTVSNDAQGHFEFGQITFSEEGDYQYQISEVKGNRTGISYSGETFEVVVHVKDDGNGQLKATIEGNENIQFTNKYDPTKITASLSGIKSLTGRDLKEGEFIFEFKAGNDITKSAIENGGIVLRNHAQSLQTTNTKNGTINFGENAITFNDSGRYQFHVSEVQGQDSTITYDTRVYTVEADVKDIDGALAVHWSYEDEIVFENSYVPHSVSVDLPFVQKTLSGRELKDKEFTFVLSQIDGKQIATAQNDSQGQVDFGSLTFDKSGIYHYVIKEQNNQLGGITYDSTQYYVDIEIKDQDGQLTATSMNIYDTERKSVKDIEFHNSYVAQNVDVIIGAVKKLNGRTIQEGEFTFALTDENGKELARVHNDQNGFIKFDTMTYDHVGQYQYILSEVKGDDRTITYDTTQFKVIVHVTDNGEGYLKADIEYVDGQPIFTNTYSELQVAKEPSQPLKEEPSKQNVQTSDDTQIAVWGILMTVSLAGLIIAKPRQRRKR